MEQAVCMYTYFAVMTLVCSCETGGDRRTFYRS